MTTFREIYYTRTARKILKDKLKFRSKNDGVVYSVLGFRFAPFDGGRLTLVQYPNWPEPIDMPTRSLMGDQLIQEREQSRYPCRAHGDDRTIEQARCCRDYNNTKCQIYNHVCSVWEADNQAHAQTLPKSI